MKLERNKGMTLLELIVTFAVSAVFLAGAAAMIVPAANIYMRVINVNRLEDIADVIQEKISDELTYASGGLEAVRITLSDPVGANEEGVEEYSVLSYYDKEGNKVRMSFDDGLDDEQINGLVLYYSPDTAEGFPWYFGKDFYKKNKAKGKFSKVKRDGSETNIICISLSIASGNGSYSYNTDFYVKCMDVSPEGIETAE